MENDYFVHPSAMVDEGAVIGKGTRVWAWCHLMKGSSVGEHCNIGENVFMESGVKLGNNVKVKNNVAIYTGVLSEDDVFIGPNVVFTNVANPRSFIERKSEFKQTVIKKGATIGANATIVCGNDIGEYAFVGAGSVVTKSVPAYTMVIGNPAKKYAYVCWCGYTLDENLKCKVCKKQYKKDSKGQISPVSEEK